MKKFIALAASAMALLAASQSALAVYPYTYDPDPACNVTEWLTVCNRNGCQQVPANGDCSYTAGW
ncbi:hypothetical protein VSR68_26905 [Paraburkholderia phymatum]|uniref:hypothetical protein n=1 Tax=Paraburkholderia phymatum TaxID=148447 RepID=UPI00316D6179